MCVLCVCTVKQVNFDNNKTNGKPAAGPEQAKQRTPYTDVIVGKSALTAADHVASDFLIIMYHQHDVTCCGLPVFRLPSRECSFWTFCFQIVTMENSPFQQLTLIICMRSKGDSHCVTKANDFVVFVNDLASWNGLKFHLRSGRTTCTLEVHGLLHSFWVCRV